MSNYLLASTIVTGGTTAFSSLNDTLETSTGSVNAISEDAPGVGLTTISGVSTTLTSVVSNVLDSKEAQTAQAVSYVEAYSEEEVNELVGQIDALLAENEQVEEKGYTRTLKNKNFS